jgi:hypothetical protein
MRPTRSANSSRSARRMTGLGALLLALLVSQWLGLLHAVTHSPRVAADAVLVAGAATATTTIKQAAAIASDGTGQLLHQHSGQAACQLFDHLLMGHVPSAVPSVPPDPATPSRVVAAPAAALTPACTLVAYDARGPPQA